ncbi:polysaccharide deacetylase family protein [Lacimicrobium sp. SS2-24]|uniref:polysaccharide deacetylase family protein n=1 Tax=Lacimicrobium sp. SS2-24 TaxID=2005569 RepID=UPI000B4ABEA7|nr:polysaccharide deacetylase family protein [Lacimicrobium sp. SS2-24]
MLIDRMPHFILFVFSVLLSVTASAKVAPHNLHASILQYHHVSRHTPAVTSVSPEQFSEHMQYIAEHHTVLPLPELVKRLKKGEVLPENAVAITFDDGFQNILENAHPILTRHGFNYTVFINPALIGKEPQQLTWDEVRQMQREGVWFANHTDDHAHLLDRKGMSEAQWLAALKNALEQAEETLQQQLGYSLKYLAYPYGEYNSAIQALLREMGYIGFAQQSGAAAPYSDFTALPRYPSAGIYANLNTLKVKLSSLAMPVLSEPINPELHYHHRTPRWTTRIDLTDIRPAQLSCYFKGQPLAPEWVTADSFELHITTPLKPGRSRVNCTAPSKRSPGRYYWHSQPFFVATQDGKWLD